MQGPCSFLSSANGAASVFAQKPRQSLTGGMLLNLISAGRTAMKWNFDHFQRIHATDFGAARPWPILKRDQNRKTRAKLVGRAPLRALGCPDTDPDPKDPRRRFINLFAPPRCGCLIFWGRRRLRRRRLAFQAFSIQHQHPRRDNNDLRWKREPLHQPKLSPLKRFSSPVVMVT